MSTMNLVFLVVVAAAVGFAIGAVVWDKPESSEPGESSHEIAQLETEVTHLKAERDRARRDATAAAESAAEMEEKLQAEAAAEARRADAPAVEVPTESPESPEVDATPSAPQFFADAHEGILRKVDWGMVGRNMSEMVTLIGGLADQLAAGEEPNAEQIGRIQQLNGPLVTAALTVAQKLPGRGVNGKFTDPSFQLNAIASTLEAAKLPLTADQAQTLEGVALDWMEMDEKRRAEYGDTTLALTRLCEEAKLKQDFFDDAFRQLTPEQVNTLSPEGSRGRIRMDLFSSGLIYVLNVKPEPVESTDQISEKILQTAAMEFGLSDAERNQAGQLIRNWVNRLPRELVDWQTTPLDLQGNLHANRATGWGLEIAKLIQELGDTIGFNESQWTKARRHDGILVPLK